MSLALILSGGGARGAYEVGVLSYVFGDLAAAHGVPQLDFVCGTSVGAINGTYLASVLGDPISGVARLSGLWGELALGDVLGFGVSQARRVHRLVLGGHRGSGLFDAAPMGKLIRKGIDWRQLARNLRHGKLRALTVTATHVPTGRPWCFVDRAPGVALPFGLPRFVHVAAAHVLPQHVLASAAIPVVFPPVAIQSDLYCDGGLRLNTPLSPAIHLGADRVLVIGMNTAAEGQRREVARGRYPGLPFLLGKVLDAFLLDHVRFDVDELERVNAMLANGVSAYGPDFIERTNEVAKARGAPARRIVRPLVVRPSQDLGRMAAALLRRERAKLGQILGRTLLRMMDMGEGADSADLASYLLFDGVYARELIALGRADAHAQRDEIADFVFGGR